MSRRTYVSIPVDTRIADLVDRYGYVYGDYPDFKTALRVLVEFLAEELDPACTWPIYVFCTDGADEGRPFTHGWAFAVLSDDTTSYIHTEDGRVEWLGTTWDLGCECDDPPEDSEHAGYSLHETGEHLPGCPCSASSRGRLRRRPGSA